jgi:type IV pilus assembly protein PilO
MRNLQNQIITCLRAQWILAIGVVLLAGGFYLFGYRPASHELKSLRQQIDSKQRTLEVSRVRAADLPAVAREVEYLQARLQRFDKKMPKQQNLDQFIRDVDRYSQDSALRNLVVQPGAVKRHELYAELPITLRFQGNFPAVHSFLRQIEDMPRLTRVRSLQVRSRDGRGGTVDVELSTSIFYLEAS